MQPSAYFIYSLMIIFFVTEKISLSYPVGEFKKSHYEIRYRGLP